MLDPGRWEIELMSPEMLSAEMVALAATKEPAVICIAALPPGGLAHTRYLCKRMRASLPLTPFVFDALHVDGQDLLDLPGAERHAALAATVPEQLRAPRIVTEDPADRPESAAFVAEKLRQMEGMSPPATITLDLGGGVTMEFVRIKTAV